MNKDDIPAAIDFLDKLSARHFTESTVRQHPFSQKLSSKKNFNSICSSASIKWHLLASAVARGLVTYYKGLDIPYSAEKQRANRVASEIILNNLKASNVFECEFEQAMTVDLLKRLLTAQTPTRGLTMGENHLKSQMQKLVQELVVVTIDLDVDPIVIWRLAKIVSPSITRAEVENQMKNPDFAEWVKYSREFAKNVYYHYLAFRQYHR